MVTRTLKILLSICLFCTTTAFSDQSLGRMPETYQEVHLIITKSSPPDINESRNAIQYIDKKNLPVLESDIPYIYSIISLSTSILGERDIARRMAERIIATKKDDFLSNKILLGFAAEKQNLDGIKKYAYRLLEADYNYFIRAMESSASGTGQGKASKIRRLVIPEYLTLSHLFSRLGDQESSGKASAIAQELEARNKEDLEKMYHKWK